VTLADLKGSLAAAEDGASPPLVIDCRRSDLVWLPLGSQLDRLEDQINSRGYRQVPVFDVPDAHQGYLPEGPPPGGLPLARLRGLASRDGLARALARRFQSLDSTDWAISASATGSA
jgi:hypothetical protein